MSAKCQKRTSKYSDGTLANLAWLPFHWHGRDLACEMRPNLPNARTTQCRLLSLAPLDHGLR